MKTTSRVDPRQIADAIEQGYDGLDTARAAGIAGLLRIREVKTDSLRRELESAQKSGDRNAVARYTAMVEASQQMIASLRRDMAISATNIPTRKPNAVVVYGHVRRQSKGQVDPITNSRVGAFEKAGQDLGRQLAETTTNSEGYFTMEAPIKTMIEDAPNDELQDVVLGYVGVFDPNGKKVLAARTIPLLAGSLSYRELLLTDDSSEQPWPEPPKHEDQFCSPDEWLVRGQITDERGVGIYGLIVSVYDKDFLFDDRLGQAETDQNGYYSLRYRTEDFRDLIERKPDIYILVMNSAGKTLYSSKREIRYEAGRVEIINVVISSPKKT